jgi:inner membrane protein
VLALVLVSVFWGLRDYQHRRAVAALEARTYEGADPIRVSAYPYMVDPFQWYGVVETPAFFARVDVNSLLPEVDPSGDMQVRYKPEETAVTLAAKNTYLGRVYLDWAKYPVAEAEEFRRNDGSTAYIVRFRDLRYAYPRETRSALGSSVILDSDLKVIQEQFGMRGASRPDQSGR